MRRLNIALDPRLSYWSPAMPGSEKSHSTVSIQLKQVYTGCVICMLKGLVVPAKSAHIVASNKSINYELFNYPNYADDINPKCIRNYIPLCGTLGEANSCHNEFDQFLLTFIYNPMQQNFQIVCLRADWRHYDLNGRSITFLHQPYRRLLAWRSRHCFQIHGHLVPEEMWQSTTAINLSDGSYASIEEVEIEDDENVDNEYNASM